MKRRPETACRIVILPVELAGVAAGLQGGLRQLGRDVDVLLIQPHNFAYPYARPASRLRAWVFRIVLINAASDGTRRGRIRSLMARLSVVPFLMSYDAVVYMGADTLIPGGWDRRLLKFVGLRVITIFCGSDARPPYLSGRWANPENGPVDMESLLLATRRTSKAVALAERDSTYVVNHPATAQFNRRPFLDWTVMGMPSPAPVADPVSSLPEVREGAVRVLHAPSVTRWKGTAQVREAVSALRKEGLEIEYVEVKGRSNAEVLHEISVADIVVDELHSDALLAGLGTEAARSGTAVLMTGNAVSLVRSLAERVGAPHDHYSRPDEFVDTLRRLVVTPEHRADLARRLHEFVSHAWSPSAISLRYAAVLDGKPEASWFDDPSAAPYLGGWGVDEGKVRNLIQKFIDAFGVDALGLNPAGMSAVASLPECSGEE